MSPSLTALIIARNEAEMIANCIETLRWCDEIIVVNNNSTDNTAILAERLGARVVTITGGFPELRNEGLRRAKTDWLLYIDADERVTPALAEEIKHVIAHPLHAAYRLPRANILYGQLMRHGGWQHDRIVRLFERKKLQAWQGEIHEHAVVDGSVGDIERTLLHLTHRSFTDGLAKSLEWTPIEADLLAKSKLPPVTLLTIMRKGLMEFGRRAVAQQGYRDGMPGLVEAVVQAMNRIMVYIQVWEKQQRPPLAEKYQQQELRLVQEWKKHQAR